LFFSLPFDFSLEAEKRRFCCQGLCLLNFPHPHTL
jgi:hypothetical protein